MKRRHLWWLGLAAIALIGVLLGRGPAMTSALATLPTASVAQVIAQGTAPEATSETGLALSGTYSDDGERYQIGLADGYQLDQAVGAPVFTAPDGALAYSVVVASLPTETPLADIALVELVQDTFGRGEGFQTQTFTPVEGGLQVNWTGNFTPAMPPSIPMVGAVVAQQRGTAVYLLMVAAQEQAADQVPTTLSALLSSFQVL